MIKKRLNYLIIFVIFLISFIFTNKQFAREMLIYADNIAYDNKENIIAKGKAKILYKNQIISSNLIIYSKINGDLTLPIEFTLKDENNNYYYGSSGSFKKNLENGLINDVKVLLNDGSRIVGKQIKRNKNIDIITKGAYSPCTSRVKVANFLCPIWQLEGEKMLHDYDNLFLYQKHSKMRVLNFPVFYIPYLVTPSPLRKERKSGFLTPSINLNFFDTKVSQSTSLPYYFNLSEDKELTFTPTLNYGGGVDSSQRFNFDYNQIISGGKFSSILTIDSKFENNNSDKWLREGSIINNYNQNVNEKFSLEISSVLQTSKDYIQQTNPNDELSYSNSLKSSLNLTGYNIKRFDDKINLNITTYQSNQNNEDNKTIPTILPYTTYHTGIHKYQYYDYSNDFEFYNIFRDKTTTIHAKAQRKFSSNIKLRNERIKYGTKINLGLNFYNQFFNVEDMRINNTNFSNNYFRSFPILGIDFETPFKFKNNFKNIKYTPKLSLVITPGFSNSEKISNEDSSVNAYTLDNNKNLNRFVGSDKLDNSKRINLSLNLNNKNIDINFLQSYEFTNNSNFHYSQGNEKKLSDFLGNFKYQNNFFNTTYNFRYDNYEEFIKSQNLDLNYENNIGFLNLSYLDQKSKTDEIIVSENETLNYRIDSKKINNFSKISYFGLYDLKEEINKESGVSYSYFDECFGVNIDFKRNSYTENDLKPQDILTIMFSFKNVGAYKSTNLAVSETDKQEIEWENINLNNENFN